MEESINGKICYRLRRIGAPATMQDVADVFVLQQNITVIGRAKNNVDFFIDSSKNKALISRIHARISKSQYSQTQCGEDVFKIHDVSLNGTYVNDVKISTEALLRPGDVVIFGHVQGACLESGNCYKQLNSEFKFLFESFHEAGNDLTNIETKHTQEATMETPTTSTVLSENCPTTRRVLMFENSDDNDYMMLQEYASTAVSSFTKENESDEDLLTVKYTQILPHASCENNRSTKSPEKKRRRSKQESQPTDDTCSASKCIKPEGKIISWVQCDDCDEWYHVKCCGLSLRLVKVKNSKFHCGCS
ncbi:transcription factor 19-like [Paramuricea clavata]|uniref:Transcription factor 19-like n=1 Tax=Paramuricea clavata TaxID=317549 RepID=A0A6S7GXE6_PARCT|nr:transcription factor 19-like [Paramuricea clavata]